MGRKIREERQEKREDYAAKISKNKRKSNLMAGGILVLIAIIIGYSGYVFVTMDADVPGAPPGAGKLGGEHEHASLLVRIFGDKYRSVYSGSRIVILDIRIGFISLFI